MRGTRQTEREGERGGETQRAREKKMNAETLLQKLSPPDHVIPLYRGDAEVPQSRSTGYQVMVLVWITGTVLALGKDHQRVISQQQCECEGDSYVLV